MGKKKRTERVVETSPATNDAPASERKKKSKAAPIELSVDICPRCNKPCHATEGTQDSIHLECLTEEERAVNEPTDAPAPKKKAKKTKATDPTLTLEDLAAKFLKHLEDAGKSNGTLFSYKLELVTSLDEIGKDTKLADLTPTRVLEYFNSDRVMRTRTGVAKARPTLMKTQRVLRMALQWAEDSGLIAQAPLPEQAATY